MRDACAVIETVKDNIWRGKGQRPPRWMDELVAQIAKDSGVGFMRPDLMVTRVECESTFGGRWFAYRNGIGVILHPSKSLTRGVTVHEMGHFLRWAFGGDEPGEHDEKFYRLMRELYPAYGISYETAMTIEHAPPRSWKEGRLW